ncbi:MAG: DNA mismatch repair protein MutS [Flavobacteriaceae bacterium]|nr:MAG: DNA mismatch repair protein MutS [Flavobacteriaceae bacterium]
MNFKKGDLVSVLDDVISGEVVAVQKETVTIETTDGFMMKFTQKELVKKNMDQHEISKKARINNYSLLRENVEFVKGKPKTKEKRDSKKDKQPPMEVDLHIHQLTNSRRGMGNYDMLNLQIETAKRQLEFAIRNRIPRVVFVHGVGEGVLKTELDYLFGRYPVEVYAASFQKYGLGATEVVILQNPT